MTKHVNVMQVDAIAWRHTVRMMGETKARELIDSERRRAGCDKAALRCERCHGKGYTDEITLKREGSR